MKGSIHVCKVKETEKLYRTLLCLGEFDDGKLNASMIIS